MDEDESVLFEFDRMHQRSKIHCEKRCKSREENPQKLTQLSSRSHPRHLVGKGTAQKDITIDTTSDSQGSPLHQSLLDSGMLLYDIEVEERGTQGTKGLSSRISEKTRGRGCFIGAEAFSRIDKEESAGFLRWILTRLQYVWELFSNLVFPWKSKSIEDEHKGTIVYLLLKARVLDVEDQEFLENFLEEIPQPSQFEAEQLISWRTKLLLMFLVPSLTAYGYQRTLEQNESEWNHTATSASMDVLASLSILYLFIKFLLMFISLKHRRTLLNSREEIHFHAESQLSFLTVMKKCLRLIQETELVARGFTLVSQRSPISLIEQSHLSGTTSRQCPELRKLLFHTARKAILVCRETTKQLIIHYPISPELDAERGHLAFQALESYGPCLQISDNEETELYNLTDGFSVAALKGMVHLCHLHQSEYIKRLVLLHGYSYGRKTDLTSSQFQKEIMTLTGQLQDWTHVLDKSYSYHKSYLINREPKDKAMDQSSPCRDIFVAVHSLDLHLQAALTRVRALSSWLEKLEEESQSVDSDFLSHDTVAQMMQPIRAELDSCKGCWEEGISRIDRLQKKKPNTEIDKGTAGRITDIPMAKVDSRNIVKVEDPVIIDQVFEAYTDEDHVEQRDYSWEQPLTAEEKEKKKREKEEALRMLKELKSVISVRSVEMEKREADALKRYRNQADQDKLSNIHIETEKSKKSVPLDQSDVSGNFTPVADKETEGVHGSQHTDVDKLGEYSDSDDVDSSISDSIDVDIIDSIKVHVATKENTVAAEDRAVEIHFIHGRFQPGHSDNPYIKEDFGDSRKDKSLVFVKDTSEKTSDSPDKTNFSDSSDFLNISSQNSLKFTSLGDTDPDILTENKQLNSTDKSSSFMEISHTDVDSVISAISYDDESIDDFDKNENAVYESLSERDHLEKGGSEAVEPELKPVNENIETNDAVAEEDNSLTLEERLKVIHGANLSFTSNVAALAVAKSHAFGLVRETTFGADTFGDNSDETDNEESDDEHT